MIDHISKYYSTIAQIEIIILKMSYIEKGCMKGLNWKSRKHGVSSTSTETIISDTMIHKYVWCDDSMSFEHWKENVKKEND